MKLAIAAALVALGLIVTPTNVVLTGGEWAGCPASTLCVYSEEYGWGGPYYWTYPGSGTCTTIGGSWDNQTSSVLNRSMPVYLFQSSNCTGFGYYQDGYGTKSNTLGSFNNTFSSIWW